MAADTDWIWTGDGSEWPKHRVTFCVNPDAHAVDELRNIAYGVNVARKRGLEVNDVVNTLPLLKIKRMLSNMRSA